MQDEHHGMVESSLDWENDPEYRKEQLENLHDTPIPDVHEIPEEEEQPAEATNNSDADVLLGDETNELTSDEIDPNEDEEEYPNLLETKTDDDAETEQIDGDVLDDQSALYDQDDEVEASEPKYIKFEEESDKPEPEQPDTPTFDEESDIASKKKSILYKIPIIRSIVQGFNDVRRFFNTFYDQKYWKNPYSLHGDFVRSRMMRHGWVFLHRIEWSNKYNTYLDKMMFVKRSELTCQDTKYRSTQGNKQIPTLNGGWLIYNIKLIPAEYEREGGFTQASAYLYMLDTSTEKAVSDTSIDLDKAGRRFDKSFIILIGGAFIIIFGFFLLGGFK